MLAETRLCRGIAKGPVAFVDEQLVGRRLVHLGMAVVVVTEASTDRFVIKIPFQIVDDDEIEQAVVVDVDPGGGDGPQGAILGIGLVEPGLGGDIGESSVRSEEHTSELQSLRHLVCRLLLEKKKK